MKKAYLVGWNFIDRGHYMTPAQHKSVTEEDLRKTLHHIIEDVSGSCRIWVDKKLAWVWDGGQGHHNPQPKTADQVLVELGLAHLVPSDNKATFDELKAKAEELIEDDDDLIYDAAAENGQIVGNVKHMHGFKLTVMRWIAESDDKYSHLHQEVLDALSPSSRAPKSSMNP